MKKLLAMFRDTLWSKREAFENGCFKVRLISIAVRFLVRYHLTFIDSPWKLSCKHLKQVNAAWSVFCLSLAMIN